MAVLNTKPHTLSYLVAVEGYEDENGDYHKGTAEWVEDYIKCDAVPAGEENIINYEDGTVGRYSYTIYTSTKCRKFKRGDKVKIRFFKDDIGTEFDVKGFHRYQHQCKIWV